jgi:hypothetical protein
MMALMNPISSSIAPPKKSLRIPPRLPSQRSSGGAVGPRPYKDRKHVRYFGVEVDDALAIAEQVEV